MTDLPKVTLKTVEVVEPDPQWRATFVEEAIWLAETFGSNFVTAHHIGSTSIPNIKAKPLIDILLVVCQIKKVDDLNHAMEARGYVAYGEFGLAGRRYFPRTINGRRSHNVHTYQFDNPEITRHLAFRDYMIAHPEAAQAYSDLKADLADRFRNDFQAYMDGKDGFIKVYEAEALEWYGVKRKA
ncbi:MAG: GrpB family protein [Chloroflexota bacterium]